PIVSRVTPTGDIVTISLKGNFWQGNFGAAENSLTLSVQYKQTYGEFGEALPVTDVTISENGYTASLGISGIDYRESYVFRIVAEDKTTTLTQDVNLSQGTPVF